MVNQVSVVFANRVNFQVGRRRVDTAWPGSESSGQGTPHEKCAFVCTFVRLKTPGPVMEQWQGGAGLSPEKHTFVTAERCCRASQGASVTDASKGIALKLRLSAKGDAVEVISGADRAGKVAGGVFQQRGRVFVEEVVNVGDDQLLR